MLRWLRHIQIRRFMLGAAGIATAFAPMAASADLLQSSHFRLDPNVAANFGGSTGSNSYKLIDAGGEGVVGAGTSQSYKLAQGYAAQLPYSISLSVLPNATYAYWPFDSGTGTQGYDVSPNADNAVLQAAPTWATGIIGQAITLNGSTQYASTGGQVVNPATFTEEIWFKTTTSTGGRLMGFGNASTGASTAATLDRHMYMNNAGQLNFGVNPGTKTVITTTASYNDGSWHHVTASLGAAGMHLYVDGVQRAQNTGVVTAGSYTGYWRMGYDDLTGWTGAPTSNFFAGTIDEARVLTRQLRDSEITNDYTAGANAIRGAFTLPNITPGQSQTYSVDAVVRTSGGGYSLFVQRAKPLTHTDNTTTIPDISGSIAAPALWSEGVTKGFGFTLTAGSGLSANWGTNPNYKYAALTPAASLFHARTGLTGGAPETTTIQYRADTIPSQKQGTYSTAVTYTATVKP